MGKLFMLVPLIHAPEKQKEPPQFFSGPRLCLVKEFDFRCLEIGSCV